jgi:hypothetical protein
MGCITTTARSRLSRRRLPPQAGSAVGIVASTGIATTTADVPQPAVNPAEISPSTVTDRLDGATALASVVAWCQPA